jgi:ABC-type phosphate transport system permease subunit
MKLFGGGLKTGSAMAIGTGVVLLAPIIIPAVASVMRPLAKAVIKGGMLAYENACIAVAETKETIEDIAAEARSDIAAGHGQPAKGIPKKAAK